MCFRCCFCGVACRRRLRFVRQLTDFTLRRSSVWGAVERGGGEGGGVIQEGKTVVADDDVFREMRDFLLGVRTGLLFFRRQRERFPCSLFRLVLKSSGIRATRAGGKIATRGSGRSATRGW